MVRIDHKDGLFQEKKYNSVIKICIENNTVSSESVTLSGTKI